MGFTAGNKAFGWLKHARDGKKEVRVNQKAPGGPDKSRLAETHERSGIGQNRESLVDSPSSLKPI